MPNSTAVSTARLEGAPTAASSGIPATSAFCISSKLARPETKRPSDLSGGEQRADQFVGRVVPAYVLANQRDVAGNIERGRRVKAAGLPEDRLHGPYGVRQCDKAVRRYPEFVPGQRRRATDPQCIQRCLAANAATRGRIKVSLQPLEVQLHAR